MLRVCGATEQRDPLSAARCWCGGLFCGKGGFKASLEFRRDVRSPVPAYTHDQFRELLAQQDLLDEGAVSGKWTQRVVNYLASHRRTRQDRVQA